MGNPTEAGGAAPLSERICDAACLAFAAWTLLCHAFVAAGGSLRPLVAAYAVLLAVGAGAWWWRRHSRPSAPDHAAPQPPHAPDVAEPVAPRSRVLRFVPAVGLAAGLLAVLLLGRDGYPIGLWWALLGVLAVAGLALLVLEAPIARPPLRDRRLEWGLWGLAILCALFTLAVHRPDIDDAFYVNLAVGALDRPDLPLLAVDTLHGIDALPIHYPAYRLHSFELANAALILLTGIPPIYAFHWVAASLAALLVPLAHARLARLLTPHTWLWTTAAVVWVLIFAGETHRWYGNFAFVRIWQGKGVFLFVFMPLVYAYAIRFALRPGAREWLLLAAAQLGAVGCSSSAIWAAPVGAFTAMCCVLRPNLADLRRFATGAAASLYVLVAGALLKGEMAGNSPTLSRNFEPGQQLYVALHRALGDHELYLAGLAAIFVAWACCRRGLAQRFAIALPLAVTAVLLNPYLDSWIRSNLTGPSYWRSMWVMPVPLLMAFVLTAPLQWNGRLRGAGWVAFAVLCAAFAWQVPRYASFSPRNEASVIWPRAKVNEPAWRWAAALNQLAPREQVVAPRDVSAWIPTFRRHAYPMKVRVYLGPHRRRLGEEDYRDRNLMTNLASGDPPRREEDLAIFRRGLGRYAVRAVCLRNSASAPVLRQILRSAGFRRHTRGLATELWLRAPERARNGPGVRRASPPAAR